MRWPVRARSGDDDHVVDRGRVWCRALHRDVDIDHCYSCPAFQDLMRDDRAVVLRCRPVTRWFEIDALTLPH
jgi:hypothetical protein